MPLFKDTHTEGKNKVKKTVFLKDNDMALIICSFSAIFGILNYRYLNTPVPSSPLYLTLSVIFVLFWLGMAFSGGRRYAKGFYIPASIIWGVSLIYLFFNYLTFRGFSLAAGSVFKTIVAYAAFFMLAFPIATVFPLCPGLAALGLLPNAETVQDNAMFAEALSLEFLIICAASIVLLAAAFFLGRFYEKKIWRKGLGKSRHTSLPVPDLQDEQQK
jgi:hypothetical protein